MLDLQKLNRERLVLLTVVGRKSGKPHTVKIWFAADNGKVFVTSARGMDARGVDSARSEERDDRRPQRDAKRCNPDATVLPAVGDPLHQRHGGQLPDRRDGG